MSFQLVAIEEKYLTDDRLEALNTHSSGRKTFISRDTAEIASIWDQVEVSIGEVPLEFLENAPALRWHQQFGTGVEWLSQHPDAIEQPFILTSSSDDYGIVLAEHLMSMILAFARQLPSHFRAQQEGRWESLPFNEPSRFELRGKTLLIVGVGSIGQAVAKRAKAFEMEVIGIRANPDKLDSNVSQMYGLGDFHKALRKADIVINCLPLTSKTRHLFNGAAFGNMNPSAYFLNIGRGSTVDETALIAALQNREIAGAGLDVYEVEPLPASSPLRTMPNVIVTPHSGGNHRSRYESYVVTAFDNLKRYTKGMPLRNVVDKKLGY